MFGSPSVIGFFWCMAVAFALGVGWSLGCWVVARLTRKAA
jgi:hypothetical protein